MIQAQAVHLDMCLGQFIQDKSDHLNANSALQVEQMIWMVIQHILGVMSKTTIQISVKDQQFTNKKVWVITVSDILHRNLSDTT